jgi:hypothetical protein
MPGDEFDVLSRVLDEATFSQKRMADRISEDMGSVPDGCPEELLTELLRLRSLHLSRGWQIDQIAEQVSRTSMLSLSDGQRDSLQKRLTVALSKERLARMAHVQEVRNRTSATSGTLKWGSRFWKAAIAVAGLAAGTTAVLAYLGWNPFTSTPPKPPKPASVLNRLLAESDKIKEGPLNAVYSPIKRTCTRVGPAQSAAKCWLFLSQAYIGGSQFRSAISAIDMAEQQDTRIADPYDSLGVLYYDLIIFDLVNAKRYHIVSPTRLIVDVFPSANSRALAHLATEEFKQAQGLPFIGPNVQPVQMVVTTPQLIAQAENQINAIGNGQAVLQLNADDLLGFMADVHETTSNRAAIQESGVILSPLREYMKQHRDQFLEFPPNFSLSSP